MKNLSVLFAVLAFSTSIFANSFQCSNLMYRESYLTFNDTLFSIEDHFVKVHNTQSNKDNFLFLKLVVPRKELTCISDESFLINCQGKSDSIHGDLINTVSQKTLNIEISNFQIHSKSGIRNEDEPNIAFHTVTGEFILDNVIHTLEFQSPVS